METEIYKKYKSWLKETHDISPEDTYCSINMIEELVSMRDEYLEKYGETEFTKILKEEGVFEENKQKWLEKYEVLTFEEYKNSIFSTLNK